MSVTIDTTGWEPLGRTTNSSYYRIAPHVLGVVPDPGSRDDGASARANIAWQHDHLRREGGGVVVIFFDNMVSQDKDARRVYQAEADPALMRGTALVGGTMLARAIGSFFLGISRPRVRLKMFGSLADALAWADELNRAAAAEEAR